MEVAKEEVVDHSPLFRHQDVLKELSHLDPDESLRKIADDLVAALNCEAVSILLWNEAEQKLITEIQRGIPVERTGSEKYEPSEGITGKYIFSQARLINCHVDAERKIFVDKESGETISDRSINWHYVHVFKEHSKYADFKSLLGAPCFDQNQKPGVVKLINKIDRATGQLADEGFSDDDVQTLRFYLKNIEFILQSKWSEKRIEDLFTKLADITGSYDEVLRKTVVDCATVLNYRACVVRLLEKGQLRTRACNLELPQHSDRPAESDPSEIAVRDNVALKWRAYSEESWPPMVFKTLGLDGDDKHFYKPPSRITGLVREYELKSALIVPIIHKKEPVGTFECYTYLPHDFSHQEKEVISKYADSLINTLKSTRGTARLSDISALVQLINDVMSRQTLAELYDLILSQTISYFGFHYGAISRVDAKTGRIKTVSGKSVHEGVIDPNEWKNLSDYGLDSPDILAYIVEKKRSEIISGPEVERQWDDRLNREIYDKYNHKDLVRIFIPFILRKTGPPGPHEEGGAKVIEEKVLGVIEAGYHVSERDDIPEEQATLFELFINYCAGAFQRLILDEEKSAFNRILDRLNAHENLLSSEKEIYTTLREVFEDHLKVNAVSIWEKSSSSDPDKIITDEPFKLIRVAASKLLESQYDEEGVTELRHDTYTGDAVKRGEIIEVPLGEINVQKFAHPQLVLRNNFHSMIVIPILIGQEVYAAVDVFLGPDRHLTVEEKESLERLVGSAAVAMIAVQNAKLVNSFSSISEKLLDEDIETILQNIAESAVQVLHADPIILFRYEKEQEKFQPHLITHGNFIRPEVKNVPSEVKENDWPNIILNLDEVAVYLETEQQYLDFQRKVHRVWRGDRFDLDFWHREKIASLAALRLEHKGEPVGVMFVNYRTPQKFNEPTRKLIRAFAAQAASAIARNKQFWESHRRDSFSLSVSEIVASLAHNSVNLLNVANSRFARFEEYVSKAEGKMLDKQKVQEFLDGLKVPWDELVADFEHLEEYRKFDDFTPEVCQVEPLIDNTLFLLRLKFEKQKIVVKKVYNHTPAVSCDKHQFQHMLLNLFVNAADSMGRRGTLTVATDVKDRYVRIRITDTGLGFPPEQYSKIFKPFYTTKKHGSGLGLPISLYIARRHGGRIDFASKVGKETTFSVLVPAQR